MTHPITEAWRVRVLGDEGGICGAGVLIDPWRVLTCAHVVAKALGVDSHGAPPVGVVTVDFPALSGVSRFARVMTGGWVPTAQDGRGDVTVLVLDQPAPDELRPANFSLCGELDRRSVRAYGHPIDLDDGVWAEARVVGSGGPGGEWIQLDGLTVTGRRVERGFSGAGVFDGRSLAVVGVVVAEDLQVANRVAWMLPVERIVTYLPGVPLGVGDSETTTKTPDGPARSSVVGPERRLSQAEHRELVAKLARVPGMLERPARDLYLHAVQQQIAGNLRLVRQDDESLDVWALTYGLLEHAGALRAFIGVLVQMHPTDHAVAALEEFVERRFPDLLLESVERVELEGLLAGVAPDWVNAAYRAAVAVFGAASAPAGGDVVSTIRQLEGFGRLRGGPPPPLLVFADDLAHKIGGLTSVRLHRWLDGVGDRLEIDRAGLGRLCDEAEKRRSETGQVFIVVQLQPDSVDADRYLMSAWLQEGQQNERPLLRDDVPRTLREVADEVDVLLSDVPEQVSEDSDEPTIEFILPRRLIGHPVDEWEFDRAGFSLTLGIRYPVVVRSLERLRKRSLQGAWRRKWRVLADEGHRANALPISHVEPNRPRDLRALYSALIADDRHVCLAVPFPPAETEETSHNDEFTAGLTAGIPVIVWSREPVDGAEFSVLVGNTLAGYGMLNLPRRMLWLRQSAMATMDGTPPAQYLPRMSLLWDDADRIPGSIRRSIRLQAPLLGDGG
ncbi:MAG TPA: trypsin-like peptidase domain-containing protein [Micromonosporaceae bacterium]|nr:trypsin-like peptidase domain-containing protein [Micromonosporaceae bacterium]